MGTVLLFDIDGTLVSCGGAGRVAMKAAFLETIGRDDVVDFPFAGGTDRAIARRGLRATGAEPDEAEIDGFLARYLKHLPAALAASASYRVMPGVVPLLERLVGMSSFALGLGTGNIEAGAREKLKPGGIEAPFRFGGFGCDHEERARLIGAGINRGRELLGDSGASAIVIGDTPNDISAAHENGASCIGVGTGPFDRAALQNAGADVVFDDLTDDAVFAALGCS